MSILVSCLRKGGFDGIAMLIVECSACVIISSNGVCEMIVSEEALRVISPTFPG